MTPDQPFGSPGLGLYDGDLDACNLNGLGDLSDRGRKSGEYYYRRSQRAPLQWLGTLFPSVTGLAVEAKQPKTLWPAPALALSRSLLRVDKLAQQKGGLVLVRQSDGFDTRRKELASRSKRLELVGPTGWLGRTMPDGGQVSVTWCDAKEAGAYTTAFQLGRVRASNKLDLQRPPLELEDASLKALHVTYANYLPTMIEEGGKEQALLILKHKDSPEHEIYILVDTSRHVILSTETRYQKKTTATTKFDDFVELAGSWWARSVETLNDKGERQALATQTITELSADDFAERLSQELAGKDKVLFPPHPRPRVADAKTAATAGKATFDDQAVLTLHFAATQQWARALEHLQQCEGLSAGKQGMRWLRDAFLLASRRHEELRQRLLLEATALAEATDADTLANDYYLAQYLMGQARQVLEANEALGLSDKLLKIHERQPTQVQSVKSWRNQRVSLLQQAGQNDKVLTLAKALAVDYPLDCFLKVHYSQLLAGARRLRRRLCLDQSSTGPCGHVGRERGGIAARAARRHAPAAGPLPRTGRLPRRVDQA